MNKKKELAKNTIILAVGKICTQFVSFLLLPLYTALLLPEESGVVDLFNTYILLLVPLFNWQFENGLFRFMIDCRNDLQGIRKLFSTVFSANFLQILVYLLFYCLFGRFINSEYRIFLAIDVCLNILLNTLLQFPRGLGNNTLYSLGSFLSATFTLVLNVLFIAILKLGAFGMFSATAIAKALTIVFLLVATKTWRYYSIKIIDFQLLKEVTKYSVPLVPNSLAWWVIGASDRTIISIFLGMTANGLYYVANKFSSVYSTVFSIFNISWTESVSVHLHDDDCESFLKETINSMFLLFSAMCFGIISVLPFLFRFLVNIQYAEAYNQIPILMIAILFQVLMGLFSVLYVALKKSKELAKSTVLSAVINVLVNVLLIKRIGLYAASISTLVAFAAVGIYRYFDVRKYVDVRLKPKVIISTLIVGLISVALYYYNNTYLNVISLLIVITYSLIGNQGFVKYILSVGHKNITRLFHK